MPIAVFTNNDECPLTLHLTPDFEDFEVPHLASIGFRYRFEAGAPDKIFVSHGKHAITLWCDAEQIEVEIVHPTAFDRLLWALCVIHGHCGAAVDDKPVHVTDLLPTSGMVTAAQFARAAIAAEGYGEDEPAALERWAPRLEALFREHMETDSVPVESLTQNLALPFERS